jgi:hypothetical protein
MKSIFRRKLDISVMLLNGTKIRRRLRTPPGEALTQKGVEAVLESEVERVEKFFPGREFRLVELLDGGFNFVEVPAEPKSQPAEEENVAHVS